VPNMITGGETLKEDPMGIQEIRETALTTKKEMTGSAIN